AAAYIVIGDGPHRPLEFQALVVRQVELWPDFYVELVDERPTGRNLNLQRVDVGRRQRSNVVLLGQLLQALQEHFGLDLIRYVLAEALLDDLPRRLAGPEAGHVGVHHELAVLLVEAGVDVRPLNRYLDVLLTRADVGHFNRLVQLLRRFFFAVRGFGGLRRLG